VEPLPPPDTARLPLIDLTSGYVRRAASGLPTQGVRAPWRLLQNYRKDVALLTKAPVQDEGVRFTRHSARASTTTAAER
jgi:hypothetical protein